MKKLAALLLMAVAMASTSQASLEVRSTIADSEGYYTMSLVDTKTGEVVDQKRFQYQLDGAGVDYIIVGVDEAPAEEDQTVIDPSPDSGSVPDVADADGSSDGDGGADPNLSVNKDLGAWHAIKSTLDIVRQSLQESLHHLEVVFDQRQSDKAQASGKDNSTGETLVVPDEVLEYPEEASSTDVEIESPKN